MGKRVGIKYSGVWELNLDHAERRNRQNKDEGKKGDCQGGVPRMENKRLLHQLQRARTPLARQDSETAELIGMCFLVKMEKGRCLLQQKF